MANIFIDGGGNWKRIVDRYLALSNFDKVYVFEPNPIFYNSYDESNYELIQKAIWTEDKKLDFFISKDENQVASSLIQEKMCKDNGSIVHGWKNKIEVDCIHFSKWLRSNVNHSDNLTIKLDIEGAEYAVLQDMIESNVINMVDRLFVEFHSDTMPFNLKLEKELIKKLEHCGVEVLEWD